MNWAKIKPLLKHVFAGITSFIKFYSQISFIWTIFEITYLTTLFFSYQKQLIHLLVYKINAPVYVFLWLLITNECCSFICRFYLLNEKSFFYCVYIVNQTSEQIKSKKLFSCDVLHYNTIDRTRMKNPRFVVYEMIRVCWRLRFVALSWTMDGNDRVYINKTKLLC
jgi:hypothetical protein